ncbi:MAG: GNAT family N-acetyltransferase [Candidatus Lokiarchaeota archaeon]|nr:GNAT family N-acetyltransferase [Candidatus Lokiarchaeota archaeon]
MSILVRYATDKDIDWCNSFDNHVSREVIENKIRLSHIIIAEKESERAGYVRLEYMYSQIPFLALIRVVEEFRRKGIGRKLLEFIEEQHVKKGHSILMSSSTINEAEPQAWHRYMGFEECGIIAGMNEGGVGEVFFRKSLS